jgi:hypothetical protein
MLESLRFSGRRPLILNAPIFSDRRKEWCRVDLF